MEISETEKLIDETFQKHGAISIAFLMNKLKISLDAATRLFYKIEADRKEKSNGLDSVGS